MTTTATVTMVLVCGIVWGGFVVLLARAVWREGRKQRSSDRRSVARRSGDEAEDSRP